MRNYASHKTYHLLVLYIESDIITKAKEELFYEQKKIYLYLVGYGLVTKLY